MEKLPKIIVLDVQQQYKHFVQAVQPFIFGTDTTPFDLAEKLWAAFFVKEDLSNNLDMLVSEFAEDEKFKASIGQINIATPLHMLRQAIENQVKVHCLYFDRGYMPYDIKLQSNQLITLHFDPVVDNCAQNGFSIFESREQVDECIADCNDAISEMRSQGH